MSIKVEDSNNPQEDIYNTLDTLKISLREKQILKHIKLKQNDFAIITGGKNIGRYGKVIEIEETKGKKRRNALVTLDDEKANRYHTILKLVFATGETQPLISLPEAS